jgi:phage tail-like protein
MDRSFDRDANANIQASTLNQPESYRILQAGESTSRLLRFLPDIYSDGRGGGLFLDGFLRIFDSIWQPIERQIDYLYAYFDPRLAPSDFLPWLGTWVDLVLDENWPEARRRDLIQHAVELYRRRGTARALSDYLTIFTGTQPEIAEDADAANPFHFTVSFRVNDPAELDQDRVRRIIEEEKPAHTTYTLKVEKS